VSWFNDFIGRFSQKIKPRPQKLANIIDRMTPVLRSLRTLRSLRWLETPLKLRYTKLIFCSRQAQFADSPAAPSTAYQPGVIYVVQNASSGHVVLPTVTSSGPTAGGRQVDPASAKDTFIPHIILSCVVLWLCGLLFGLAAFVLART